MFLSVPEWEIFLKAILGRFPRLEIKYQRRSFLVYHTTHSSLCKFWGSWFLQKKIAPQLSRTFFSVQETRKQAAEYIWGNCDSAFLQTVFFWLNKCASPLLLFGRSPKLNKRRWWQFQSWRQWWGWRWFTMITMMTQILWWHWYLWRSKEKSKALVRSGKSNRSQWSRVGTSDTSGFFWLCKSMASEKGNTTMDNVHVISRQPSLQTLSQREICSRVSTSRTYSLSPLVPLVSEKPLSLRDQVTIPPLEEF